MLAWLGDADARLTPTVASPSPKVGAFVSPPPEAAFRRTAEVGAFTAIVHVSGQPAVSVPVGLTRGGLPIGVQIAGRLHDEGTVLAIARKLEEAMPWIGRAARWFER